MNVDVPLDAIRHKSKELGFDDVGVCEAKIPEEDIEAYLSWLRNNYQGDLSYMENQIRCDPVQIFPNAKSAIIFVTSYKQEKKPFVNGSGLIASYARGRDYHHVHRSRLKKMILWLEEYTGKSEIARGFSDSVPVLEKALAVKAGLGWFGKNTLLIHRKLGTFTLLSGIFTSLNIPYTTVLNPRLPRCGTCNKCIDACPTQAIISPYTLDAKKCLSYHLIESKKEIPEDIRKKNPGYIFGCDICQDVCPHNVRPPLAESQDFRPEKGMGVYLNIDDLAQLEQTPEKLFGTPLKRRGLPGLKNTLFST